MCVSIVYVKHKPQGYFWWIFMGWLEHGFGLL